MPIPKFTLNIPTPCKDCTKRTVGCHPTCEEYVAYRKKLDELSDRVNKARDFEIAHGAIRYGYFDRMPKSARENVSKKYKR